MMTFFVVFTVTICSFHQKIKELLIMAGIIIGKKRKMTQQSNTQKVVKGISSQTLVTLVMGIMEIVVFSIMSRLLSKEDFGLFAAISAITIVFGSLSEAGIGSALIQKKNADKAYVNTSFTVSFISGSFFPWC